MGDGGYRTRETANILSKIILQQKYGPIKKPVGQRQTEGTLRTMVNSCCKGMR